MKASKDACAVSISRGKPWPRRLLAALAALACAANLTAQAQPKVVGTQVVSRSGLTLYVFDNDVPGSGRSVCNPPCSHLFRPYLVEKGAQPKGEASVLKRADGSAQWAWKGRPLYLWVDDQRPGQMGGDGINHNTWHVARP
jgi:predicted lipoprotein with Yx(FWY)xxD motif